MRCAFQCIHSHTYTFSRRDTAGARERKDLVKVSQSSGRSPRDLEIAKAAGGECGLLHADIFPQRSSKIQTSPLPSTPPLPRKAVCIFIRRYGDQDAFNTRLVRFNRIICLSTSNSSNLLDFSASKVIWLWNLCKSRQWEVVLR